MKVSNAFAQPQRDRIYVVGDRITVTDTQALPKAPEGTQWRLHRAIETFPPKYEFELVNKGTARSSGVDIKSVGYNEERHELSVVWASSNSAQRLLVNTKHEDDRIVVTLSKALSAGVGATVMRDRRQTIALPPMGPNGARIEVRSANSELVAMFVVSPFNRG